MGYQIYEAGGRDCGYGVPAVCEQPVCTMPIHRGLAHLCGETPGDEQFGCGGYFCGSHLFLPALDGELGWRCDRCREGGEPYGRKPDTPEWINWKLTDESWAAWREENPDAVKALSSPLATRPHEGEGG